MDETLTIVLTSEDGEEVEFEYVDEISVDYHDYVVLFSKDDSEEAEVVIMEDLGPSEDGASQNYASVDDEDLAATVYDIFREKWQDVFDFED